jgi:hypothetical protein
MAVVQMILELVRPEDRVQLNLRLSSARHAPLPLRFSLSLSFSSLFLHKNKKKNLLAPAYKNVYSCSREDIDAAAQKLDELDFTLYSLGVLHIMYEFPPCVRPLIAAVDSPARRFSCS